VRLTKEREAELRADNGCEGYACDRAYVIADLLAELDAVRAERDAARADERAKVVSAIRVRQTSEQVMHDRHAAEPEPNEWTRRRIDETRATVAVLRDLADAIERGEHER